MTETPVVTIITPTKNRADVLRECIASVVAQTFTRWEHVIIDDGSDDGTAELVTDLMKQDARIRYIQRSGDRAGANICRNLGLRSSQAPLILFLDSDDLLAPDCLEDRVSIMDRNLDLDFAVFVGGTFRDVIGDFDRDFHPHTVCDDLLKNLIFEFPWQTTGPIWRKNTLERLGGFDESLLSMQDVDLHIRAIATDCRYTKFPKRDYYLRWRDDKAKISVRQFTDPAYLHAARHTPVHFLRIVQENQLLTWSRKRALAGLVFANAENWVRIGRLKEAYTSWKTALESRLAAPHLYFLGLAALTLLRTAPQQGSLPQRVVAKWKGWVRFRQEPSLLKH